MFRSGYNKHHRQSRKASFQYRSMTFLLSSCPVHPGATIGVPINPVPAMDGLIAAFSNVL